MKTKIYSLFSLIGAFLVIPALAEADFLRSFDGFEAIVFNVVLGSDFVIAALVIWLIILITSYILFRSKRVRSFDNTSLAKFKKKWITLLILNVLLFSLAILGILPFFNEGETRPEITVHATFYVSFNFIPLVFLLLLIGMFSLKKSNENAAEYPEGKILDKPLMKATLVANSIVSLLTIVFHVIFSIFPSAF